MRILPTPTIYSGQGEIAQLIPILKELSASCVMVVTDQGIINAGIYGKIESVIKGAGVSIILFDEVQPDPEISLVKKAVQVARENSVDAVIGLGGGSSIDTAKVASALITNEGEIDQYIGIDMLTNDSLPVIAIPTTAGTGSEVTHIAILSDSKEQLKKGLVSTRIIPQYAILDPDLTIGMPPKLTAYTGMDALTHALEAYKSINANGYSDSLALQAVRLITKNILVAYEDGSNVEAREEMLVGSLLAGMAFANAGVAAVHAFAYPLGGMYHVPHGLANSVMLSTIMEFNMIGSEGKYLELGRCFGADSPTPRTAIEKIEELCDKLNIPCLSKLQVHLEDGTTGNIPTSAIPELAKSAMKVTRLLANNPRKITLEDAEKIYMRAYTKYFV